MTDSTRNGASWAFDAATLRMLESLPSNLRMLHTRRDFPHVLTRIAASWIDPRYFHRVMQSLLIDDRGNRQGFPFAVMNELTELRSYYFTQVRPDMANLLDRSVGQ